MSKKSLLLGSLAVGAALVLKRASISKSRSTGPARDRSSDHPIDEYIEAGMRRLRIPGASLALVDGDRITHLRGFGRARPHGEAPTPQTPFFIGSLTKSFTALAVMQLVEAGEIDLDAPVQRYLPWFHVADLEASARMTVRHLLNQASGLPESSGEVCLADFDDRPGATERQARALVSLELSHPVGTTCEYSDMNYNLLGLIIEAASGESYADYIRKHIFTPLEMSHSYATRAAARQNGLAMGHQYWFTIPVAAPDLPVPHGSLPSGQLISTAEDLARYLIAHLNGGHFGRARLLSAKGIDELQRGAIEYRKMGVSAGKYAMGWFDGVIGRTRIVWHNGTNPDFWAYMALLPGQRKGVVLLLNACHWWLSPVLTEFAMGVAGLLAGEQYSPTPFPTVVPWMLRGQLLIPVLEVADVVLTLWELGRWSRDATLRPARAAVWKQHVLRSLISSLLAAVSLRSVLGKRRGYLKLFMPDFSLIAMVCGGFAVVWSILRTGMIHAALRKMESPPRRVHLGRAQST